VHAIESASRGVREQVALHAPLVSEKRERQLAIQAPRRD
jgi:hypothetical protein